MKKNSKHKLMSFGTRDWHWILYSSCSNKKNANQVEEEKGKRRRRVHHSSKAKREHRQGGWRGGGAIRWCLALGIRKYRMWHLHVRRLRQTTVRAHVILTQDTGRADYWTSAYCSLSSLTLSQTHKQEQPLNLSIQRALRAQRSNRRDHPNKLTDHQSVQYVGLELWRPGLSMMKRYFDAFSSWRDKLLNSNLFLCFDWNWARDNVYVLDF